MFCSKCGAKLNFADAQIDTVRGEKVFRCKDLDGCFRRFQRIEELKTQARAADKKP